MGLLGQSMTYYAFVFHPITVLGVGTLLLIYEEWSAQSADRSALRRRVAAFLGAGTLAVTPTVAYFLLRGGLETALEGSSWRMDMLVAGGALIAAGTSWFLWRRFDWGALVPDAMEALAAVTVPYAALSPFWDISGHVIFALMPTLYLALVDRKYAPLLAVPVVMVPNRVYLNAHSLAQSVVGFAVAAAIVFGLYRVRARRPNRRPGSPAS